MCNIPGHANMVDFNFYSFCGQLFPFHTSTDNAIKKNKTAYKKQNTRTNNKGLFNFFTLD